MEDLKIEHSVSFDVRKRATWKFILFTIITNGYYLYFWLWKFVKDFNKIQIDEKNKINYWFYAVWLILYDIVDIYATIITWDNDEFFNPYDRYLIKIWAVISFVITYFIAMHINKYAKDKYNTKIKHSGVGIFFFGFIYANFALNTFVERTQKALNMKREKE